MRPAALLFRDWVVYPLLFAAWAGAMYCVHGRYSYVGTPPPGISLGASRPAAAIKATIDDIAQKQRLLSSEKSIAGRAATLEAVGAAFARLYDFTRTPGYLDSAEAFCGRAAAAEPASVSAHSLLGRILTEKRDFPGAVAQYRAALARDPRSAALNQTIGILLWFDLKQPLRAKPYLEKTLGLDSLFPTVNYVLGVIDLDQRDSAAAVKRFENELRVFRGSGRSPAAGPVDPADARTAACYAGLRLAFLYSTSFVDEAKAKDRFETYLSLETDPTRRQESIREMNGYWKGAP